MCYYLNSFLLSSFKEFRSAVKSFCDCMSLWLVLYVYMYFHACWSECVCTLDVCLMHTCTVIYTLWYIDTLLWTWQSFTDLVLSTLRVFNLFGIKGHLNISGFFPMYILFIESNPFAPVKLLVDVKKWWLAGKKKYINASAMFANYFSICSILSMLSFTGSLCCCLLQIVND